MTTQISTLWPVGGLSDLNYEWKVLAFRPNGHGEWRWYIKGTELHVLASMKSDGLVVTTQRRDGDGTRLLGKMSGKPEDKPKGKPRSTKQ